MNLDKAAKELNEIIMPNSFVTLTLREGIWTRAGYYISGSHEVYDRVVRSLFREINRRIYGGRTCRRRPRNLPNWTVLETSKGGLRHVHSCIKRPDHVSIDLFDEILRSCIAKSKWLMPHCEVAEHKGGGVRYILKDGQDGVLGGSLHF
jgi:hypothetical protein